MYDSCSYYLLSRLQCFVPFLSLENHVSPDVLMLNFGINWWILLLRLNKVWLVGKKKNVVTNWKQTNPKTIPQSYDDLIKNKLCCRLTNCFLLLFTVAVFGCSNKLPLASSSVSCRAKWLNELTGVCPLLNLGWCRKVNQDNGALSAHRQMPVWRQGIYHRSDLHRLCPGLWISRKEGMKLDNIERECASAAGKNTK